MSPRHRALFAYNGAGPGRASPCCKQPMLISALGFRTLDLLGQRTGFTVLSSALLTDEEAIDIPVDSVVVHCYTRTCYFRFIAVQLAI